MTSFGLLRGLLHDAVLIWQRKVSDDQLENMEKVVEINYKNSKGNLPNFQSFLFFQGNMATLLVNLPADWM